MSYQQSRIVLIASLTENNLTYSWKDNKASSAERSFLKSSILPTLYTQLPLTLPQQHIIKDQHAAVLVTGLISDTAKECP